MENRKSDRKVMQISVRLYQGDSFVALAKTHDITMGGMFINTDVLRFPKNSSLDVVFDSPYNKKGDQHRYPATVVHRCLKGIGIELSDDISSKQASSTQVNSNQAVRAIS